MRPRTGGFDERDDAWMAVEVALVEPKVGNVQDLLGFCDPDERGARVIARANHRIPPKPVGVFRVAVHRHRAEIVPLSQEQIADLGLTDARRVLSMALNTGSSSPGELEITRSTSAVAVCCSNASVSSRVRACTSSNSRTFSIAIT